MTRQLKQVLLLRTALLKTLDPEKERHYCELLNLWLRKRCTREEFDSNVTKLLSGTGVKIHIKFLTSLSKISCGLMALPLISNKRPVRRLDNTDNLLFYKFIDKTLACPAICSARFLVNAWQSGIISVHPQVGELLHLALIYFLKELIFTVIAIKRSYKLKSNHLKYLEGVKKQEDVNFKLPSGFVKMSSISSRDLILALQLNPWLVRMGFSKYVEQVINGPFTNNVATLMPLTV
uniref:Transcriptional adapter 1 n=1 Tax=Rhodnius prolixus TaxID=13249 RepID=T1HRU0_RHOPR